MGCKRSFLFLEDSNLNNSWVVSKVYEKMTLVSKIQPQRGKII